MFLKVQRSFSTVSNVCGNRKDLEKFVERTKKLWRMASGEKRLSARRHSAYKHCRFSRGRKVRKFTENTRAGQKDRARIRIFSLELGLEIL
jgi:hypothetical protein